MRYVYWYIGALDGPRDEAHYRIIDNATNSHVATCYGCDNATTICRALNADEMANAVNASPRDRRCHPDSDRRSSMYGRRSGTVRRKAT